MIPDALPRSSAERPVVSPTPCLEASLAVGFRALIVCYDRKPPVASKLSLSGWLNTHTEEQTLLVLFPTQGLLDIS